MGKQVREKEEKKSPQFWDWLKRGFWTGWFWEVSLKWREKVFYRYGLGKGADQNSVPLGKAVLGSWVHRYIPDKVGGNYSVRGKGFIVGSLWETLWLELKRGSWGYPLFEGRILKVNKRRSNSITIFQEREENLFWKKRENYLVRAMTSLKNGEKREISGGKDGKGRNIRKIWG